MNNNEGIPSRCWCGKRIVTYVSKTEENPYRRFFRCEISLQRKKENHLFKWVDEALFDEIQRMDEDQARIAEEIEDLRSSMKKTVHEAVMKHKNSVDVGLAKMRDIILPSHGKKEYQVQVLMDGNLLKLEAKIQVEFTKVRFEDH
ncbi:hypothetical protein Bca52824_048873 [Brassica carinata]|uniref:GRF-type domain-containing protein n=1 Tax=Brassica carinata TaxID=52824 RepID=A0A8X7RPE5_BRACI|nr:hypothetical protein Bca52824_048873 [Brassica carinata]